MSLTLVNQYPKPSLEEIKKFEKGMKISLPDDYKDFLISFGGGEIQISYMSYFKSNYYDDSVIISRFFELNQLKEENKNNYNVIPCKTEFITIAEDNEQVNSLIITLNEKDYGKVFINQNSFQPGKAYYKKLFNYNDDLIFFANNVSELINNFEEIEKFEFEKLCEEKRFNEAINLVKNGLDINSKNDEEQNLIIIATSQRNQNLELTKFLIENGADVNEIYNITRVTPLILSVGMGDNPDVVRYLVENGADINHKDAISEKTALEHAKERMRMQPDRKYLKEMYNILTEYKNK